MASLRHLHHPSLPKPCLHPARPFPSHHLSAPGPHRRAAPRFRCLSTITSSSTATPVHREEEEEKKKERKASRRRDGVRINVRLDHQVEFGEHVAILGSSKDLGSWRKRVPMVWTQDGWVAELEHRGGEDVEFKFVIVPKDGEGHVWEHGDNRVLRLPERGTFDLVCQWSGTADPHELSESVQDEEVKELDSEGGEDGSLTDDALDVEAEASPFVEQWQGRAVSFMRSNEHGLRESERRWVTDGLDGVALKLVEGDRSARNWWKKVIWSLFLGGSFLDGIRTGVV